MSPKPKGKKPELSSDELKANLLAVARKHFAQQGYSGASLKDIAQEAQVANSLINYHFTDKEGLFKACIETFALDRMASIKRILREVSTREEMRVRLELFVEEMMVSIVGDTFGFEIVDREMRSQNPLALKLFQETMLPTFVSVVDFFQDAKKKQLLRDEIDPMIAASLLFTVTCDSVRKDHLGKKFFNVSLAEPGWRGKYVQHIVGLMMNGVMK
jgi:AcrR family transcriptional regulator